MKRLVLIFLLLAVPAIADERHEVVLIRHDVALAAMNWIAEPTAANAVKLYAVLQACIDDNPNNGAVTRKGGPDQCPEVTQAIAERDRELADLRKQLADLHKDQK